VDTRLDRSSFMARHVPGALYAPMNNSFNTVVGSLVVDETTPIVLVVEEARLDEAVRDLVRIGYDQVVGYVTVEVLERYFEGGGAAASIPEISFQEVAASKDDEEVAVLDVRFASEYREGHVPGAVNASYTRLPDYLEERVPEGKVLLVHCATGARSAAAAAFLAREGRDVRYVHGDLDAYPEPLDAVADASGEPALV
jgi:hydroxyacylglutathione hydrolase